VWCGVVMVWYNMIWCGVFGMYGMVNAGVDADGVVWCDMVRSGELCEVMLDFE
jgi:hypothetical protein